MTAIDRLTAALRLNANPSLTVRTDDLAALIAERDALAAVAEAARAAIEEGDHANPIVWPDWPDSPAVTVLRAALARLEQP